jgi:hypothetical protein
VPDQAEGASATGAPEADGENEEPAQE